MVVKAGPLRVPSLNTGSRIIQITANAEPDSQAVAGATAVSRTGGVKLTSRLNDDTYVGRVNLMGQGLLISPRTGESIRIEVER